MRCGTDVLSFRQMLEITIGAGNRELQCPLET